MLHFDIENGGTVSKAIPNGVLLLKFNVRYMHLQPGTFPCYPLYCSCRPPSPSTSAALYLSWRSAHVQVPKQAPTKIFHPHPIPSIHPSTPTPMTSQNPCRNSTLSGPSFYTRLAIPLTRFTTLAWPPSPALWLELPSQLLHQTVFNSSSLHFSVNSFLHFLSSPPLLSSPFPPSRPDPSQLNLPDRNRPM